jgi:hypothetical protein
LIDLAFISYDFREHFFGLRYGSMGVSDTLAGGGTIPNGVFAAVALIVRCSFILKLSVYNKLYDDHDTCRHSFMLLVSSCRMAGPLHQDLSGHMADTEK